MLLRSLLFVFSLNFLISFLSQGGWAMEPDDQDSEKRSLSIQVLKPPSVISEDSFLYICKDLLSRDLIPTRFQEETRRYITEDTYRKYMRFLLPHADVLRRDLDYEKRYPAIERMLKSERLFQKTMTSLGIISNEIEPIMLRVKLARQLQNLNGLTLQDRNKVMTHFLEEVFEAKYNQGKLVKLSVNILEDFLKAAQTLPYDSDTRKKVVRGVAEMPHLTPERRVETLFYLETGEERDSLLLPFLRDESIKLEPKYRLDGILGLRNGEERESFLCAFAANPRMPIEHRLEALMESSAPLEVKRNFLLKCLDNKRRFSLGVQRDIKSFLFSLAREEESEQLKVRCDLLRAIIASPDTDKEMRQAALVELEDLDDDYEC